jgi:DNA topoisomerase-1
MARWHRVDPSGPGISRRRAGRGFTYWWPDGRRVTDPEVLGRIRRLVIPPAWSEVWISIDPRGHIQAWGFDAKGRRQYVYHPIWREHRDREKFNHMLDFARALPTLRRVVACELEAGEGLGKNRVLACAVRLLERGFFRIGGEAYAETNGHYGLATILKAHVRTRPGRVLVFDYPAKSGRRRMQSVVDAAAFDVIASLKRRRGGGPELLAYRDGRRWTDVRSADINAYIKEVTGGDFSAKDFRTWAATVLAAVALARAPQARSRTARRRTVAAAVKEVAGYLGNTPAVARSSYIDPRIIDRYRQGETIQAALSGSKADPCRETSAPVARVEEAVLALLSEADASGGGGTQAG